MAHFAKVVDGIVTRVIVAEPEFFNTFVDDSAGEWIQTSYNTKGGIHHNQNGEPSEDQSKALRKNFAGIGYTYDKEKDAFIPPKPYTKWILNEETCLWEPPIPRPDSCTTCRWSDEKNNWIEITE